MKENEGLGIVGAPNVSSKGPVRLLPECDIVKGYVGRSSIESFVCMDWERGRPCDCDELSRVVPCAKNRLRLWILMRAPCNGAFILELFPLI